MNVYPCWYQGLKGYCCRNHNLRWMFIPELGQHNNRIHRHISLSDIVFENAFAKTHELKTEKRLQKIKTNPFHFLKQLFFSSHKPATVGGLLFATA